MYEINGYIIWYNAKNHKWKIIGKGIIEVSSFKKAKKYCKGE